MTEHSDVIIATAPQNLRCSSDRFSSERSSGGRADDARL